MLLDGCVSHPYPPHLPNFIYVGKYVYSLTFCTYERRPIFADADSVSLAFAQILRAADEKDFEITTYCFMPDHLHLLVTGLGAESDAKAFIKAGEAVLCPSLRAADAKKVMGAQRIRTRRG